LRSKSGKRKDSQTSHGRGQLRISRNVLPALFDGTRDKNDSSNGVNRAQASNRTGMNELDGNNNGMKLK